MSLPKKPQTIRNVYLDHAAATPVDQSVFDTMKPFFSTNAANPSALYRDAVAARKAVDDARADIADTLSTQSDTITFTGSGTESCNMAILGVVRAAKKNFKKPHVVTTKVEHHVVLHAMEQLEKEGVDVTYVAPDQHGIVSTERIANALTKDTVFVSVMYANNEVGSVNSLAAIGKVIQNRRKETASPYPYLHTDACQAGVELDLHVERLHVDLLSLNASKVYGPKGVGMLYVRRGVTLDPILHGGGQEFGRRPGTENVAGIVGFAKALSDAQRSREKFSAKAKRVRDYFYSKMQKMIPNTTLNGPALESGRLANNLNVSFRDVDAEALILYLEAYGIACASSSACTTDSDEVSHVLLACGLSEENAKNAIRFTLGRSTTKKDIDYVMRYLPDIVQTLRENQ